MRRERTSTGTVWEQQVGYSRAIRAGDTVRVAGTIATDDDGEVVGPGDPYEQTKHAFSIVADALSELDVSIEDVVQTRMYVTDIDEQEQVGEAHSEFFGDVRPVATMVEVSGLATPEAVVEVEAVAQVE
ncbi:Enamine deaminase RidA, house cleaning of reactive enamine intermediates, YjgF/YER057c/UK114 family [Haloarcula vallismortis]|uniref:Endoribonuclease L-PSP/translation intitiation inhibition protein n=2 Tax=Haloarcula vallismortis TaxID=28442 RepID=M0JK02_HALVA|nr:RidA family protein [Haloarcula vallismortis]EMA09462.1 endoribonuclease L-PSP/translation intitiation inhibition protein [Haloarcula vallismortis ATCC 29715]SDW83392.1 Enamine deaminase RidA, house cleaning of reactive enamine intermediates, YjgF/YER057c/UK114 family [Haloarcula vallismortis]